MRNLLAPLMLLSAMTFTPISYSQDLGQDGVNKENTQNIYYATVEGLRIRSTPEANGKVMGVLSKNEKVRVVSTTLINGKFVEIELIKKSSETIDSPKYYAAMEFLSNKPIDYKDFTGKYFVVVNVATETLRLYERQCADNSCPHKMLLETEVVVGEDRDLKKEESGKGRSILGSYRITSWVKFYQDGQAHYPSWWKEGYPDLPEPGEAFNDWMKKKIMPKDEKGEVHGSMRGAFGWYTALVGPAAFNQWTHGTIGWGEDKDKYIKQTKKFLSNLVSNPRSSGCTRNNNEAIAFIRQMVEIGTPIIKIYAKEALMDPWLSNYPQTFDQWDYILTKKAGQKSDRKEVIKSLGVEDYEVDAYWSAKRAGADQMIDPASPLNQILEVGTYYYDTRPTPIAYTPGEKLKKLERSVGRKGNVYGVKNINMSQGIYYVDAGILDAYHHPTEILETSGFLDEETPSWMDMKNLR
jgi:L,D-transpeptidase catalytic domain